MNEMVTLDFVFRFQRKIASVKAGIIEFLINNHGSFYGSYRDFAVAMGKTKSDATNLCRQVHELETMGILTTDVEENITKNSKTLIWLNQNWKDRI